MGNLIIDRSKWLRGMPGVLLNYSGNKCVLGFLYSLLEFSDDSILNKRFYPKSEKFNFRS